MIRRPSKFFAFLLVFEQNWSIFLSLNNYSNLFYLLSCVRPPSLTTRIQLTSTTTISKKISTSIIKGYSVFLVVDSQLILLNKLPKEKGFDKRLLNSINSFVKSFHESSPQSESSNTELNEVNSPSTTEYELKLLETFVPAAPLPPQETLESDLNLRRGKRKRSFVIPPPPPPPPPPSREELEFAERHAKTFAHDLKVKKYCFLFLSISNGTHFILLFYLS